MPTREEVKANKATFEDKYQSIDHFYADPDSIKLYLKQSADFIIKNMFYNG